ncbi:MAG: cellulase family glycosylhydrolase, partial [Bacillota bacterium]|nr:cellulase family glycosylhydrolase [Bacillota bacterium]
ATAVGAVLFLALAVLVFSFMQQVYQIQTNMNSLDNTIELAAESGIYVQLCILHHGMFSENVNPMWPGSDNTWYTDKYGANPYGEILDNPGQFFTADVAKESFKNQLSYIVARWGYSDHLMAWELFNEVDWIEQYNATSGTAWHREMAEYINDIDPYGHMVTTSVKGDSFLSGVYNVFDLEAIDYVNVHSYGIYNHVTALPTRQKTGVLAFQKPILYAEVGYSGNGGAAQLEVDPANVTLHQELWGGMMGAGAGTGMNWWWESWIHPSDAYHAFQGAAAFGAVMDLTGGTYAILADVGASVSNVACKAIGYRLGDRAYAYVYDQSYNLDNQTVSTKSNVTLTIPGMTPGSYVVRLYDTVTGAILAQSIVVVGAGGSFQTSLSGFSADIAVAVERTAG